jgi:hypothetical protein
MSHATYKQGNQGDLQLLMVRGQTDNLTLGPSFGYNLCFKCLNGSCKPILDIYEDSKVHWDSNSQSGNSLGSVRVHSLTLSYTLGSMRCDSRASPLALTFVSPCFGCEPKARVTINIMHSLHCFGL